MATGKPKPGEDIYTGDPDERTPTKPGKKRTQKPIPKIDAEPERSYRLTPFTDIKMRPLWWQWAEDGSQRIPGAKLVLTAGHGDVGKSTFNAWRIARLTRGELPGDLYGEPSNCYIAAAEDDLADTIKPRLLAASADMKRVFHLQVVTVEFKDGIMLSLPTDFGLLEEAILEKDAADVFFDSLMATIDMKYDTHKGRDARQALMPLMDIASRTGCNITGNVHFNKSGSSDPAARLLGSQEFRNVPRGIIYFAQDKDGMRVLSRGKGNLGREWTSLEFTIEDASFDEGKGHYHPGLFVLGGEAPVDAGDILAAEGKQKGSSTKTAQCVAWLIDFMEDNDGRVEASKGREAGEAAGYSPMTITRARREADVLTEKVGTVGDSHWEWVRAGQIKQKIGSDDDED